MIPRLKDKNCEFLISDAAISSEIFKIFVDIKT
jgi:hypothetical protein